MDILISHWHCMIPAAAMSIAGFRILRLDRKRYLYGSGKKCIGC